jgi:hypothetical protein
LTDFKAILDIGDREEIARAHREATIRHMVEYGGTIMAVQDTTGVNYNTHVKTEGDRVYQRQDAGGSMSIAAWGFLVRR